MSYPYSPVIITFTDDCGENSGGFFVEVGIVLFDDSTIKIDDFCVHPCDLGLPEASKCNYEEARHYAEQYIRNNKEYNKLINMTVLKETTPFARKEHRCEFCYGRIKVGQKYLRQTNKVDGTVGDFICHTECMEVASMLKMFDDCDPDYGLTDDMFREAIDQYVYANHYDEEADDIAADWAELRLEDQVRKIYKELQTP